MNRFILAGAVFAAIGISGAPSAPALAAASTMKDTQRISAQDRQLLSSLSPEARRTVMARMQGGQTVDGIIETMVLNRLSDALASGSRITEIDVYQGNAQVTDPQGQRRTVSFDVEKMVISEQSQAGGMSQQPGMSQPRGAIGTPYPSGLGKGDRGAGATSEGNMGPRERGMGEKPAP